MDFTYKRNKQMDVLTALINLKRQLAVIEKKADDTIASIKNTDNNKPFEINEHSASFWKDFDVEFNDLDFDFAHKIYHDFSNLTTAEYRICQMIKINMKNKDISKILGLSIRTVETHRLNIRKKMKLKKGEVLHKILGKI